MANSLNIDTILNWLGKQCQDVLLEEKWLITTELRISQLWKERLVQAGYSSVNLHNASLRNTAISLATSQLAARDLKFADQAQVQFIALSVLREQQQAGKLEYFGQVEQLESFSQLLSRTFSDLRLAMIGIEQLASKAGEDSRKAKDLQSLYAGFLSRFNTMKLLDYAGCLELLCEGFSKKRIPLPTGLCLLIPEPLNCLPAEQQFFEALAHQAKVLCPTDDKLKSGTKSKRRSAATSTGQSPQLSLPFEEQRKLRFFAGHGEVNELREVLRQIAGPGKDAKRASLDSVEILYTDYESYVPLVHEMLATHLHREDQKQACEALPVTYSEGLSTIYSRPGRGLRAWLKWLRADCDQSKAVQLIREGLLSRPDSEVSFGRLSDTLRRLPIGFSADRYLPKIRDAIGVAEERIAANRRGVDRESDELEGDREHRDFGFAALSCLEKVAGEMLFAAPVPSDTAESLLERAKSFLLEAARVEGKLDRLARNALLEVIEGRQRLLAHSDGEFAGAWEWLEALPLNTRVLRSGPRPGAIHVAPLRQGGYSGRRTAFIVGLDENRYPKQASVDPVLLDRQREELSAELPTQGTHFRRQRGILREVLERLTSDPLTEVSLSYSCRNLFEDRGLLPSPELLQTYRDEVRGTADLSDFLKEVSPPASFVSSDPQHAMDSESLALSLLLAKADEEASTEWLASRYPDLANRWRAENHRNDTAFGEFDGWVPAAGLALAPTNSDNISSASRLECFGACPRRFFFRYGLGIYAPDDCELDRGRWLDPMQYGSLVHDLFEDFLIELTSEDLVPEFERDRTPLLTLLSEKAESLREQIPSPNEDAFLRQYRQLEETCEIFLRKEEDYCRKHAARPWVMEASIGLGDAVRSELDCPEPLPLQLQDGRVIRVAGRIDRIDRLQNSGSESYAIWDYKSGSTFGFQDAGVIYSGRKLQPLLYAGMLRHRLEATDRSAEQFSSFGYFFPSPRADGFRIYWRSMQIDRSNDVLSAICNMIEQGIFVATTDSADCKYCEYKSACGDIHQVTGQSREMAQEEQNSETLGIWRDLRIPEDPYAS